MLPAFLEPCRRANRAQILEDFIPILLWLFSLEKRLRRCHQPLRLAEIERDAQRVEPVEERATTIRLHLGYCKLIAFLFDTLHELATWGIGRLATFDAMRFEPRVPALRGIAIWTARMFLFTIEKRTHRFPRG